MDKIARQRLTVFLLRDVDDFADALDPEQSPHEIGVSEDSGIEGRFYWQARTARTPDWVRFVTPALTAAPPATTASASGLLVMKCEDNFFGLTFGYGRGLLDQSKIVRQFGLRTVLNTIDPAQIRSLDTRAFEDMVVAKNTQASRSTSLSTFDVDTVRDILRAVTGQPRDDRFGKRLSGADAIVLNIGTKIGDLNRVCTDLLTSYSSDSYKTHFAWVDDLAIVADKAQIDELDDLLLAQLRNLDTGNSHLAMPDPLDWAEVDSFRITGTRNHEYDDLDLDAYLHMLDDPGELTVQRLKQRRVQVRFARSNDWDSRWGLYQCIVSEQRTQDGFFVLIEGRWLKISESLAAQVDEYASRLGPATLTFPPAFTGESEADYNERLANVDQAHRLYLDGKLIAAQGAASRVELCDVLLTDGTLVHVKRKSRSSSLSHLFAQGVVSMTSLLLDDQFRQRARDLVVEHAQDAAAWDAVIPEVDTAVDRERLRVSYVVLANSPREGMDWLPFFSKLNLMYAIRAIQVTHGVALTIDRVDVVDRADAAKPKEATGSPIELAPAEVTA